MNHFTKFVCVCLLLFYFGQCSVSYWERERERERESWECFFPSNHPSSLVLMMPHHLMLSMIRHRGYYKLFFFPSCSLSHRHTSCDFCSNHSFCSLFNFALFLLLKIVNFSLSLSLSLPLTLENVKRRRQGLMFTFLYGSDWKKLKSLKCNSSCPLEQSWKLLRENSIELCHSLNCNCSLDHEWIYHFILLLSLSGWKCSSVLFSSS